MRNSWIVDRVGQRNKEAFDSFGPNILARVWDQLPKAIGKCCLPATRKTGWLKGYFSEGQART